MSDKEVIESGILTEAAWRSEPPKTTFSELQVGPARNSNAKAKNARGEYVSYFNGNGKVAWQDTMVAEVEFLAEKEMVCIIPNFNFDRIFLISGEIGPFRAGLPVKVPIWMAINLRQRQKCRIIPPDWMDVDKLLEVKEIESQSRFFTKMPSEHYMVEARLLLGAAAEDVPRTDEIRTVLKVSRPLGYGHTSDLVAARYMGHENVKTSHFGGCFHKVWQYPRQARSSDSNGDLQCPAFAAQCAGSTLQIAEGITHCFVSFCLEDDRPNYTQLSEGSLL
uniref:(California timema) hypothetical protein n=1 Tax=Timema californicum TaxID=61474 RepID=A0A7R9PAS4_TIMCA|nr:unnamed protein product [Timema californicum]